MWPLTRKPNLSHTIGCAVYVWWSAIVVDAPTLGGGGAVFSLGGVAVARRAQTGTRGAAAAASAPPTDPDT